MSGIFGIVSKSNCVEDLFYGTDYHSHLGTRRAGMVVYDGNSFNRAIHNIENTPFRTKFGSDLREMEGKSGIGCISDYEPQPLIVKSHHGTYAITTVSKINNVEEITREIFKAGHTHFLEMSGGEINATELVAMMINQKDNLVDGIRFALDTIDGSLSVALLTPLGIYVGRDNKGRTPIHIGRREENGQVDFCFSFEDFAYQKLGFENYKELKAGEIDVITNDGIKTLSNPERHMKICTFLWVYYGYPSSSYEGVNVEEMRYRCGAALAKRDDVKPDIVAGVPDSGTAHAVGYANASGVPFSRPFIKYTPTWSRSFMPTTQSKRNVIAKMKLIAVKDLIKDKKLLLIDDSIVRGTQLRETTEFLYENGAKEVHIRPACPPLVYGCKYVNFSRSSSEMDLITRRVIEQLEGTAYPPQEVLDKYTDPDSPEYAAMVEEIRKQLNFTSLKFNRLDDMLEAVGIPTEDLCTFCWDGKE
ncbi:MAG: amidophosphoribosyltransferase [Lachnospiraceae bacterium]|nr:amidophosphoribosyltransferase [Lachnospiraceae bacterium]